MALEAGEDLHRAREDCFLNASLVKSVPKECARLYAQLAGEQHVDALIVLGPGLNNGDHAGGTRHRDLPEYLRGWCFVTGADEVPSLLNLSELLLIGVNPQGAVGARVGGRRQRLGRLPRAGGSEGELSGAARAAEAALRCHAQGAGGGAAHPPDGGALGRQRRVP